MKVRVERNQNLKKSRRRLTVHDGLDGISPNALRQGSEDVDATKVGADQNGASTFLSGRIQMLKSLEVDLNGRIFIQEDRESV